MTIWQILTRRLKKFENLAREVLEGSTRFPYFFILFVEICQIFILFQSPCQNLPDFHTFLVPVSKFVRFSYFSASKAAYMPWFCHYNT